MPKYLIDRTFPGAGQMDAAGLAALAGKSNEVLKAQGTDAQWIESYVTDDKIICVFNATGEKAIRAHAKQAGFPVDSITQVHNMVEPTSAERA